MSSSPTSPTPINSQQMQRSSPNQKIGGAATPRRRTGSEMMMVSSPPSDNASTVPKPSTTINPDQQQQQRSIIEMQLDPEEYEIRKRLPPRFPARKNDIYVTRRTNFKAQLARCEKLLTNGYDWIVLHGLGAAVNRALNLALQVKRRGLGSLEMAVNTSTIEVTDDLEPLLDDLDSQTRVRNCSAVHIKIYRSDTPITDY